MPPLNIELGPASAEHTTKEVIVSAFAAKALVRLLKTHELSRAAVLKRAAVCAGSLLLATVAAGTRTESAQPQGGGQARQAHALRYVGVSENWATKADGQSKHIVDMAQQSGFNSLRIDRIWRKEHPSPTITELQGTCDAAKNLVSYGMPNLLLNLRPEANGYPTTPQDFRRFKLALDRYINALVGEHGCVRGRLPKLMIVIGNEPNIDTFCSPQTDSDQTYCARATVRLQHQVYPYLKNEAKKYGLPIIVIGGVLSSHHAPLQFLGDEAKARYDMNISQPDMDMFAFQPYPLRGSTDPMSGINMYDKLMQVIEGAYGKRLPVIYTEVGIETIPEASDPNYYGFSPPGVLVVGEDKQAQIIQKILDTAAAQGVQGVFNFLLIDECNLNPGWQSGLYDCYDGDFTDPNNQPKKKDSWLAIHQAILAARQS